MDIYNSKGWKNRRKLAEINSYANADDERQAIRAERARLYADAEEVGRLAAEAQAAALTASRMPCPCCSGTGSVSAPTGAAMLEAWYHYHFSDRKPSQGTVAALLAIARGEPTPPGTTPPPFSYGMARPDPVQNTTTPRAEPVEAVESVEPQKPTKRVKPVEDTSSQFTADGALIEL